MNNRDTTTVKMGDCKKYNFMENTLTLVNSKFISLPDDAVKRNNKILDSVLHTFIDKMKDKDPLFNAMYSRIFYGGSYYDGLRVGKPEEFDLDLTLFLPKFAKLELSTSNIPGFVHLQLKNDVASMRQLEHLPVYKNFLSLFDDKLFFDTQKVLRWMESLVHRTMNDLDSRGSKPVISNTNGHFEVIVRKEGPALTLSVEGSGVKMDVDLVICFVFREDKWPKQGFKPNPVRSKPEFFIVPKTPKSGGDSQQHLNRYWRLSFQEQEKVLIERKQQLKPTIKLLKKLRDTLNYNFIASYYIKTAVLHVVDNKSDDFWTKSLSFVFMTVLKEFQQLIEKGKIPYYWNKNNNLLGTVNSATLQNASNRLKYIINDIEKKADEPNTVAKYLLSPDQFSEFLMHSLSL